MSVDILVPPLSQTMDSLVLIEWTKQVGDPVIKGETLFTVETDKATLEVESPATGILKTILAEPGEEIKVKSVIGVIASPGEAIETERQPETGLGAGFTQPEPSAEQDAISGDLIAPDQEDFPEARRQRIFATPRARHLSQQNNLDLEALRGTGTGLHQWIIAHDVEAYLERLEKGPRATPLAARMAEAEGIDLGSFLPERPGMVITKADVEKAILDRSGQSMGFEVEYASPAQPASIGEQGQVEKPATSIKKVEKLSATRKTIARRMVDSHASTVPVTYMVEADATRLVKIRRRILGELPDNTLRPTITDMFIRITCLVLTTHPQFNAIFDGDHVEIFTSVHMGLAIDTPRGLIVPVMREAQSKGLIELAQLRSDLVERTRLEKVNPEELTGGTFTITNLGTMGIDFFTPVINIPQVAILGIGRIREVPVVRKRKVKIRQMISLSLTCDHRIIDGAPAARFLQDLTRWIEEPDRIWL